MTAQDSAPSYLAWDPDSRAWAPGVRRVHKDHLGRELCRTCSEPLPSDGLTRELHLLRHVLENIENHMKTGTR